MRLHKALQCQRLVQQLLARRWSHNNIPTACCIKTIGGYKALFSAKRLAGCRRNHLHLFLTVPLSSLPPRPAIVLILTVCVGVRQRPSDDGVPAIRALWSCGDQPHTGQQRLPAGAGGCFTINCTDYLIFVRFLATLDCAVFSLSSLFLIASPVLERCFFPVHSSQVQLRVELVRLPFVLSFAVWKPL